MVLQKQHNVKHKRNDFLKYTNTKIRSKAFYAHILSYNTFGMQKKMPVMTHRKYHHKLYINRKSSNNVSYPTEDVIDVNGAVQVRDQYVGT